MFFSSKIRDFGVQNFWTFFFNAILNINTILSINTMKFVVEMSLKFLTINTHSHEHTSTQPHAPQVSTRFLNYWKEPWYHWMVSLCVCVCVCVYWKHITTVGLASKPRWKAKKWAWYHRTGGGGCVCGGGGSGLINPKIMQRSRRRRACVCVYICAFNKRLRAITWARLPYFSPIFLLTVFLVSLFIFIFVCFSCISFVCDALAFVVSVCRSYNRLLCLLFRTQILQNHWLDRICDLFRSLE